MDTTSNTFTGLGVAFITPFKSDLSIDFSAIERLIDFQIKNGADYIVALGTTAETPTLSFKEKQEVVNVIISAVAGRVPLVVGLGGYNTSEVIENIESTDFKGVNAILSVSPYYNKPTQKGIYSHFKAIAEISTVPVILYNIPGRTGVNVTAETTLSLAHDCPSIIGIKEAAGSIPQACEIINDAPENFAVISGDDGIALPMVACGGQGVISVVGNAYPAEMSVLTHAALMNNYDKARLINKKLFPLYSLLFEEGNPAGIKALMKERGLCDNTLRLPLVSVSDSLQNKLSDFVQKF
jgi:4-hydroxy-tetrahydrodipicolinate synthase